MITGIVLAAGSSTRMGSTKQLLPYLGRPLIQHVIDRAGTAGLGEVLVVLGHEAAEIERSIHLPVGSRIIVNPEYASGQASSLQAALVRASKGARAALVLLGDQPDVTGESIQAVVERFEETGGPVVRAEYRGVPGHPVLLHRSTWDVIQQQTGDRGAGPVLARHGEWIVPAQIDHPPPFEVDTPEDYRLLMERASDST